MLITSSRRLADAAQALLPQRAVSASTSYSDAYRHRAQKLFQVAEEGGQDIVRRRRCACSRQSRAPHAISKREDALAVAGGRYEQRHARAGRPTRGSTARRGATPRALQLGHDDTQSLSAREMSGCRAGFSTVTQWPEVVAHGRQVIHAVGVVDEVLALFSCRSFQTAVQVASRVGVDKRLAVQLHHQAQRRAWEGWCNPMLMIMFSQLMPGGTGRQALGSHDLRRGLELRSLQGSVEGTSSPPTGTCFAAGDWASYPAS